MEGNIMLLFGKLLPVFLPSRLKKQSMTYVVSVESLESRAMLATYSVSNLNNSGVGSFRDAIDQANANAGTDEIAFTVAGTVSLTESLPFITQPVLIDGSTAPSFDGTPVVAINFDGASGFEFHEGSDGSTLQSLAIVNAGTAGVTVSSNDVSLFGNYIGVLVDGETPAGNTAGGLVITSSSSGNQIGKTISVSSGSLAVASGGNLISGNNGSGITIFGNNNLIQSNLIGTTISGDEALPNTGDGIEVKPGSEGNLIGNDNPVAGVSWYDQTGISIQPITAWQGIRSAGTAEDFLICGTSGDTGVLYNGEISGENGIAYTVDFPSALQTSVYGPDLVSTENNLVRLVGSYINSQSSDRYGFFYEGTLSELALGSGIYRPIPNPATEGTFNYAHSTDGGLVVGGYDGPTESGSNLGPISAYIYDVDSGEFLESDMMYPDAVSTTAYGIWHNGGTSYTIAGGYSMGPVDQSSDLTLPIGDAYLVDFDSVTKSFSNWQSFSYPNASGDGDIVTHFEGISGEQSGVYTLAATSQSVGEDGGIIGSFVKVIRNTNGSFGDAEWYDLNDPNGDILMTSVSGNAVTGVVISSEGPSTFQATINTGFQLSNVISGNNENGISLDDASSNTIVMNYIGTALSGDSTIPNDQNGILVTNNASNNMIGGQATGGNAPVSYNTDDPPVFFRPPQGNLISGNTGNGILISEGATGTTLSGNYVGTTASGTEPLGNSLDGVAIENATNTSLLGTTFQQSPFVFYNVLAGNSGNGLRITDSSNTTVQANFMGVGADNETIVANGENGLLASGSSSTIQAGGVIPMGNVVAGNEANGIDIRDTVSGFVSFNNFTGLLAFAGAAPNKLDGIHITSVGGDNLIRTCLIGGNGGNGIVLAASATGVTIEDTAAGTNSDISNPIPNAGSGIVIKDQAHNNVIGGYQPSVETRVHLSGNLGYGLMITGEAHNNSVFNTSIGSGFLVGKKIPNQSGGVFIGPETFGNILGGTEPIQSNHIAFNNGTGITVDGSQDNSITGNIIQLNSGNGITLNAAAQNKIGDAASGNRIITNSMFGLYAAGDCTGTTIVSNVFFANGDGDIDLSQADGITFIATPFIQRPQLRRSATIYVSGSQYGPQPIDISYADIYASVVSDPAAVYFVTSKVSLGRVEKKSGGTWVDVSTPPTTSNPRELLRLLSLRVIKPDDELRWIPPAESPQAEEAFSLIGWNGKLVSESKSSIRFELL
ncbi:MAG: right-handed parallel beta-helix repeat-containing protein [Planctomycetaceae bacterium]|jgi:trimeric autotransporter adhesin|nr:right-handed parallel beta-helix repeat-containing protein [Planctomycetaceae bacterium]